jgi:serine/threonine protein kinase
LIAMGGMGAVYHAIQTSLEREVAIKILPVEFGKDRGFCESFEAEAKAMAKLNHPNLISVYDFGDVNGMLFIVMEYVPGQSLHEACHGAAIDSAEAIRLMAGISQGLAHAHKQGILHRDIKPANILLDDHLQPKIGDFGLARPVDVQVKEGEAIFGTPGYTAPEVVDSRHAVDQRADIFSLGVLLHELLTGLLPESDPRPPSSISSCDPRLDAVVHKATHPTPLQRYQDTAEMADALEKIASTAGPRVLQTASPAAYRPPVPQGYSYQPSKKGGGGMLVAVLLIVGVVVVIFFRDQIFHKADPSPDPAPVVDQKPESVKPSPIVPEPEPVVPAPSLATSEPEPVDPAPSLATSEPAEPEPGPVASEPETEPVKAQQPKSDVLGFIAHARSVMIGRCDPDMVKRDEALKKNLDDFKSDAWKSIRENLEERWHRAARREVGKFLDTCKDNGNRMGEGLGKPLEVKKWLVALHEDYQNKEAKIDGEMTASFAKQEKTYLYGLGLKVKALEKTDDPAALEMIKAEIDKVTASTDYFSGLMLEAKKES